MTTTAADQNLSAVMDGTAADGSQAAESGRTENADVGESAAVEAGGSTLAVTDENVLSGEAAPQVQEAQTAQIHPFWSQRAREEALLAAARPAFLDSHSQSGHTSSGSTEMRAVDDQPRPTGEPAILGPGAAARGNERAVLSAPSASDELGLRPGERMVITEMKKLMEVLLKQNSALSHQNTTLQQRLDKLEEERSQAAWRSAGSGVGAEGMNEGNDNQEVQGSLKDFEASEGVSGASQLGRFVSPSTTITTCQPAERLTSKPDETSVSYQHGFEEGYLAAKQAVEWESWERDWNVSQSPPSVQDLRPSSASAPEVPAKPLRDRTPEPPGNREVYLARVNTTPQGTPVPMQPPPPPPPLPQPDRTPFLNVPPFPTINANLEDRRCTAHFGESEPRGDGSSLLLGNTRQSEWQKLFRGEPVLPSEIRSSTFGVRGEPVGER